MLTSREVGPLSFQELFHLNFSVQLQQTEGDQQDTQKTPPLQTHTDSAQLQAKFFQCQLQHQNEKTPWFCSRQHLLLPRKRHKAAGGICYFPCWKKSAACAPIPYGIFPVNSVQLTSMNALTLQQSVYPGAGKGKPSSSSFRAATASEISWLE